VQVQGLTSGVQAVAAAWDLSCSLNGERVYCWGDGEQGGLVPFEIGGISPVVTAVLAYAALVKDAVYVWDRTFTAAPIQVQGLDSGVQGLSSGACAIKNHAAYCWGNNGYGQLGNGTANGQITPALVQVKGLTSGVTSIVSGYLHVCAVMNGNVYCWGNNLYGQLGHQPDSIVNVDNGCTVPPDHAPCGLSPVQVQGLPSGVTAITAGTYHSCAVANGLAYCWGANQYGQLGDGTTTTTDQPVQVKNLTNVTAISAGAYPDPDGYDETCAVADGDVYCWGSNAYGQLGDGTTNDSSVPVKVQFP
jgi:alpha-tubulin suppressor-like RCC1 family protein